MSLSSLLSFPKEGRGGAHYLGGSLLSFFFTPLPWLTMVFFFSVFFSLVCCASFFTQMSMLW